MKIMKFDLHVHTSISPCSRLELDRILATAADRGLDGVCITDHDTMAARHHLREGIQDNGLYIIFGMEYATPHGDFLIFGPFEQLRSGLAAPDLLSHVERVGGVAIAAHPFRRTRPTSEYLINYGLCRIIEGINGRNSLEENEAVLGLAKRYSLTLVGGSDAHTPEELGRVVTSFSRPVSNRSELISALKTGRCRPEASRPACSLSRPARAIAA